jgi:hypothetical protein
LHTGGGDQNVASPKNDADAVDGRGDLFEIANVGAKSEGVTPGLLDFELGEVKLGLAAGQQRHAGARLGESHSQPFSDAAAGAGDEHALILEFAHALFSP